MLVKSLLGMVKKTKIDIDLHWVVVLVDVDVDVLVDVDVDVLVDVAELKCWTVVFVALSLKLIQPLRRFAPYYGRKYMQGKEEKGYDARFCKNNGCYSLE